MKRPNTITADAYRRLLAEQEKKNRQPKGHPEHDLQVACVAWFRAQYPRSAQMLFAVPNGGRRGKVEAARMKAEGVTPGVADLILLEGRGGYGSLCIEMKTRKRGSGQTEKQEEWQRVAERHGNKYVVTRDLAAFCREVSAYMRQEPTRSRWVAQVTGQEIEAIQNAMKSAKDAKF